MFVEAYLKEHPTLGVWDNFESLFDDVVTAPALRAGILKLGARWAELRGGTRLLITSPGSDQYGKSGVRRRKTDRLSD